MIKKPTTQMIEQVREFITRNNIVSPLRMERELGINIMLIRQCLNKLEEKGIISLSSSQMILPIRVMPQKPTNLNAFKPTKVIPQKISSTSNGYSKPVTSSTSAAVGISAQTNYSTPRMIPVRIPENVLKSAGNAINEGRSRQKQAKQRQKQAKQKQIT